MQVKFLPWSHEGSCSCFRSSPGVLAPWIPRGGGRLVGLGSWSLSPTWSVYPGGLILFHRTNKTKQNQNKWKHRTKYFDKAKEERWLSYMIRKSRERANFWWGSILDSDDGLGLVLSFQLSLPSCCLCPVALGPPWSQFQTQYPSRFKSRLKENV